MQAFGSGRSRRRREDPRLLTGGGRFVDDAAPAGALHAAFLRSPVAHARIAALDVRACRAMPGVALALTAQDVRAAGFDGAIGAARIATATGPGAAPRRPWLAEDRVRFVGEAVAMVLAETLQQAHDAIEAIELETEDLPVSMLNAPGGPAIHDEASGNLAFDWSIGDPDATKAAFAAAAHVVEAEIAQPRIMAASLEPRGAIAEWNGGALRLDYNGQGVWGVQRKLAAAFRLQPEMVRVTTPDVGGGFGMKAFTYPEHYALALGARLAGRPARWMSGRGEAMLSDNGARALVSRAAMAFDADHRLMAYRVETDSDLGAYNGENAQFIQSELFAKVLTGVYDVPAAHLRVRGVYTNAAPVDAYRGAGRPEAQYVLERTMGLAARRLGVDPADLRRRNFIRRFPHRTPTGETYDVGDFPRVLDGALAASGGFEARRAAAEARGLRLGRGLAFYIESILGDPVEGARVVFEEGGTVALHVGTQSNGQGHETAYAGFLADHLALPDGAIRIVQGDSALIPKGGGTGGSRSMTAQGTATLAAARAVIEGFEAFLAELEGAETAFDGERFRTAGSNRAPDMLEAAAMARAAGREDLLDLWREGRLPARSFPNGCHVAEVEIDPETGLTRVSRYDVIDDFGNMVNPMLVEGQVHGGVAQGIGQAIGEFAAHDGDGQLLTASFMDYAMPRAHDVPPISFGTRPTPCPANPLGIKGCGEAGTVGALAAMANAVTDALAPWGIETLQMPFTPQRVWNAIQGAGRAAAG
ncbi:carbon-monoxide dehydrogenase large subunit [Hasllibacter halocynthiae]|uniref:Carbon-monoxide dehydrogenase large subunit n=1 Tax=Hasllibacter halocynthiae TaxID=595589 RepID=A0A2T0X688_9RHOB|nr:xanthine dehydrogenase family protein molybdopterin-binding subunit [Hasllibacter halocynthiae]PRY94458.1 carbon-monoxide dehydrogenase large subunit [Hasllibacter halocynthiae]